MNYSLNYRKILMSASVIAFVSALVFGGTQAFFSDEETSTGNTFSAGAIDLQIDNSSYGFDYNDPTVSEPTGEWGENTANSWQLTDLTNELFFDFVDLKPGDYGEDTISLHVTDNDAWACMAFNLTGTPENGQNEPEAEVDETAGEDEGELQNYLSFLFWHDDGDNVLETDEEIIQELSGLSGELFNGNWLAIADSENADNPLAGGSDHFIGKGWCFGQIAAAAVAPDDYGEPTADNTGFTCDISGDHNDAQTDGIVVDVGFNAVQSRNNDDFLCSELPPLEGNDEERELVGALLSAYVNPEEDQEDSCDATVSGGASIQTAVNAADDGDTICVDTDYSGAGDTFPLTLDVPNLTLAGLGNAGDATIPGGTFIDANGVTFTGLTVDEYDNIQASENAAIYIHNGISGVTVSHNSLLAPGDAFGANAKGIVTEIGSGGTPGASGLAIHHNVVDGWNQGMFFNTANYDVHHNDIYDNNVGIANDGPDNSSIHHNDFAGNVSEAVGVAPSATNGTGNDGVLTVNINNLAPGGSLGNDVNQYGSDTGADVDATGNWWDGDAETDRTNDTAEVDTSGEEVSAFPEN